VSFCAHTCQPTNADADDGLSDDIDHISPILLPIPDLGNLHEIENHMRAANSTPGGREALAKFILAQDYIPKLIPLVDMAEDLESVSDLHRLCSIMKMLILLNDSSIIEYVVTDPVVLGVVGALECTYQLMLVCSRFKLILYRRPRLSPTQSQPPTVLGRRIEVQGSREDRRR
jgi:hypothetical protein